MSQPIPVTVLTGFLGAGKTTLLNRILTEQHGKKIAVIENEFGEVGVDNQLVIQSDEEIFEMNNGCICCTVRGDLLRILGRLMKRKDRLDAVLIETTGLANPAPVAQTFFSDPEIKENYVLDGIVTVVDAKHVHLHLDDSPEAQKQVAFADVILLNKTDLVTPADLDALERRLKSINAVARVHRTQNANVRITNILGLGGFNLGRAIEVDPQFLEMEYPFEWAGGYELAAGDHELEIGHGDAHDHAGHDHHHECAPGCDHSRIDVVVLPVPDLAEPTLARAIHATVQTFSDWENAKQPGDALEVGPKLNRLHLRDEHGKFRIPIPAAGRYLLFTGHDVPTHLRDAGDRLLKYSWDRTFRHEHTHDSAVSSVGLSVPGDLDGKKLNDWISDLLARRGGDLYRMKGVLCVKGTNKRLVCQGVHMLFDAKFDREWQPGENRTNTLVFIGKNLDRAALTEGFRACLAG